MIRTLFVLAFCLASASAFVAPVNNAVASPAFVAREAPKVNLMENVDMAEVSSQVVAQSSNLLASNVQDFGGYAFPVFGIGALAALILFLAPPLVDE
mmetsp:Transcript_33779/g.81285  ORF Transcript_33779/g.81285 Transcript_33779/m.81285 type:complete len:97 (-) Transcript_33779:405-695(-)|eukprot:CAMPEP_0113451212 /NCGR_PEP_ID=MMETSP0014_2-20120614/6223_1 /TAXON_ID=2857 /ORGANISM="Nitzschia sp." /LENGTH=96 /DNA_ID=CAMNT_0000342563 /DNA_START=164 /DNA_END=454 /DNA_ORIENTATION=- /assembly_acc=CAM_ASM_000159